MNIAKYVIVEGCAIVFSAAIQHVKMVGYNQECSGAGFVTFSDGEDSFGDKIVNANCFGESISLGIKSRGEIDSAIVTRQICNPPY